MDFILTRTGYWYFIIRSLAFILAVADYEKAIDYLNRIINWKADLRTDLQCYARLLHLIAHYELGNFDLLEYLIKSVYRFMAKMENLSKVEEEILLSFDRSFRVGAHALKPEFEKLLVQLKKYEEQSARKHGHLLIWMLFPGWKARSVM